MCDKIDFVVCRLCLNSGGLLINIFDKNNKSEFMLEKTIEDLINVKVVEDANYPWLVCSTCMEKLTEFRLFKHRCAECLFVFYNRIQRGCNPVTKDWLTIRQEEVSDLLTQDNKSPGEHIVDGTSDKVWALSSTVESVVQSVGTASVEMKNPYSPSHGVNLMAVNNCNEVNIQFPGEIKKEIEDETIASDAVDGSAVDVRDDMIVVKEEIDTTSGCYVAPEIDTGSSMVTSMHEGDNHWSDNEDSSHLGPPEDGQLPFSFNEEVDIKEELDVDVPREEGCLGEVSSQLLDGAKGQDDGGKDSGVSLLRTYLTSNEAFAQEDIVKSNVTLVRPVKKANHHRCGICPETFGCKRDLNRHVTSAHSSKKKHQCHHCSRQFTCQSNLRIHMSTHTDERPHQCKICSKAFKSKANLDGHMWTHTSDLPLKCEICSKGFKRKAHLDGHMLTHTGEKPHKCEICAKSFTLKQHLRDHILFHTGIRPYKCEVCGKGFNLKKHLEAHMSIHNDQRPHKCELCPRAFTRKDNLDGHMLTHSGAKPHECDVCSKTFTMRRYLKSHMLTHSGQI